MLQREVEFDQLTGKQFYLDSAGEQFECGIYGDRKKTFKPGVTGTENSKLRSDCQGVSKDESKRLYLPLINKFSGYCHFPRPISKPFFNESGKSDPKVLQKLKNHFKSEKSRQYLREHQDDFKNIGYYTGKFAASPLQKKDKETLLSNIDNYVKDFKKKNQNKIDNVDKDPNIRALKRFKNKVSRNQGVTLIEGHRTASPAKIKVQRNNYDTTKKSRNTNRGSTKALAVSLTDNFKTCQGKSMNEEENDSQSSENERRYAVENLEIKVKTEGLIAKRVKREAKLINGYVPTKDSEERIFRKNVKKIFKNSSDFYDQDMQLFRKGKLGLIFSQSDILPKPSSKRRIRQKRDDEKASSKRSLSKKHWILISLNWQSYIAIRTFI